MQYDRDEALEQAMDLFWTTGLAATSLDALSQATGMTRPSLAGAFGDKEKLYLQALERYREASLEGMRSTLGGSRSLRTELGDLLRSATDAYTAAPEAARGCLLIGTASVEAIHRLSVRHVLQESLVAFNRVLEDRFRLAVQAGELEEGADVTGLAAVASAVMHSLAVRARAGESREALDRLSRAAVELICPVEQASGTAGTTTGP